MTQRSQGYRKYRDYSGAYQNLYAAAAELYVAAAELVEAKAVHTTRLRLRQVVLEFAERLRLRQPV